jgi:O-antigen ligase
VPARERVLTALLILNVLWLAFALGGVRLWGQMPAVAMAFLSLLLLPRWDRLEVALYPSPVIRLLKLPLFWFGAGLYLYLAIQSWNPSWVWTYGPQGVPRLVSQTPPVPWLPSGMQTPFDQSNPLRSMLFICIPWLSCCAAWAGLATRRSVQILLHAMALIGVLFAFVALRQHFLGSEKILGLFSTVDSRVGSEIPFWGTLINSNHGAFFLILANGLCLGLFLSGWTRDVRLLRKGGGAWLLYLGLAILCTFAVLMAQARAAIFVVALQWIGFLVICSVFMVRSFGARGTAFPAALLFLIGIVGLTFIINPNVYERQKQEWFDTFRLMENPEMEARTHMVNICKDMIADKPWLGHGGGSFRYLYFHYKKAYPEFVTEYDRWVRNPETGQMERRKITLWFQNAHVDFLEYLVEWGLLGSVFPLLALLWLMWRGLRSIRGWDTGSITILYSVGLVFLGTAIEFHLRIPLVLLATCLTLVLVSRQAELQAR